MGNLKSARRKLNAKSVHFAQQVEKRKLDLAKEFVKERVQNDANFARDVLKAVGDLLPEDIKTLAQETIQKDEDQVIGQEFTETPCEPLEDKEKCCGHDCGCHDDIPLGDGFVATQSDGGGQIFVHETEIPGYQKDGGLPSEEDPSVSEKDLENALKKHISNSGI